MIISHANQLVLATDAMQRENNSCPQLCLHPSQAVKGDVILRELQQESAFTSVGCNQENQLSTGARLPIMYIHLDPTQQTMNGSVNQPGLIWSSMHSGKFSTFAWHQMLMRDPMHQIDLGAIMIVHLIRAILRKFHECVEIALDQSGLAAKRLGQRFRLMLAQRNGSDCQRYVIAYMSDYFR